MSRRILIVDDEPKLRFALRAILEGEDYTVAEAEDGHDALARLDEFHPDLVLLDARMPGMGGTEFLAALATRFAAPPALVVTGYEHKGKADFPGAADVLTKPVERGELLSQVEWHLSEARHKIARARAAEIQSARREGSISDWTLCSVCLLFLLPLWGAWELLQVRAASAPIVVVQPRGEPAPTREAYPEPPWYAGEGLKRTNTAQRAKTQEMRRHAGL